MGEPIGVNLDEVTGCPVGDRCERCNSGVGLVVRTATAMGGVLCVTLCPACEPPAVGPTTAAVMTLAHAGHLGIDTNQMATQLQRQAARGGAGMTAIPIVVGQPDPLVGLLDAVGDVALSAGERASLLRLARGDRRVAEDVAAVITRARGGVCLWCGRSPAPHLVQGDPLCAGCSRDDRDEVGS